MIEELYELGFSLIPLGDRLKYPVIEWKQFQEDRAEWQQVEEWAKQTDRFGIACGPVSNVAVIDTDTEEAEQWARTNLPPTPWTVKTANGYHRYYRYPEEPIRNTVKLEVNGDKVGPDVRGYGGQVVAPGTLHFDSDGNETGKVYGPLNWPWKPSDEVPTFPTALLPKPRLIPVDATPRDVSNLSDSYASAAKWLDARPTPSEGQRNHECYVAACHILGFDLTEGDVFNLVWNWNCSSTSPLGEGEVRTCVTNAVKHRQPTEQHPKGRIEKAPELATSKALSMSHHHNDSTPVYHKPKDRQLIEWDYIVSAWQDDTASSILTSFKPEQWQDQDARACAESIKELSNDKDGFDLVTLKNAMRLKGAEPSFRRLEDHYEQTRHKIKQASPGAFQAFRDAVRWDEFQAIVYTAAEQLGKGDPGQALTILKDTVDEALAKQCGVKHKTLRDIVRERLVKIANGEEDEDKVHIYLLSELMGEVSGGDVVPICGPPKTGKTFLLRTVRNALNKAKIPTLTSQYELSEAQIAEREIRAHTKTFDDITPEEAVKLLDNDPFELDDNAIMLTGADTIESCRAEVWPVLSANPQIKVWLLDYNERIYELTKGSNQYQEAQRVAKFVKDTAKKFGIVALVLLQPNNKYYDDGEKGPNAAMIDYGNRWVKDAYALWFLHKPARFKANQHWAPEDLIEFCLLAGRGSEDGTSIKAQFLPIESRFRHHPDAARLAAKASKPGQSAHNLPKTFGKTADGKNVAFEPLEVDDDVDFGV